MTSCILSVTSVFLNKHYDFHHAHVPQHLTNKSKIHPTVFIVCGSSNGLKMSYCVIVPLFCCLCVQGKQLFAETSSSTSRPRQGKKKVHYSNKNSGVSARTRAQTKKKSSKKRLVFQSQ